MFKTMFLMFLAFAGLAFGAPIAAPDTAEILTSISNVFGAILAVAVVIYGYNKVKGLVR